MVASPDGQRNRELPHPDAVVHVRRPLRLSGVHRTALRSASDMDDKVRRRGVPKQSELLAGSTGHVGCVVSSEVAHIDLVVPLGE